MDKNYYCNEQWFDTYESARAYADSAVLSTRKYHVVFTRAEMDSMVREMVNSVIKTIDHEMECGK
jgi:hypothetical protein